MAELLAAFYGLLGFDLLVLILVAVLACMRVFRCSLSRPQKRKAAGDA